MLGEGNKQRAAVKGAKWAGVARDGPWAEKLESKPPSQISFVLEVLVASFCRLWWDLLQAIVGSAETPPTKCESERQVHGVESE